MDLVQVCEKAIFKKFKEVVNEVEQEMKTEVAKYQRSGDALRSISKYQESKYTVFVGATGGTGRGLNGTDHLAMLDDGNGGRGKIIRPKHSPNLIFPESRPGMPATTWVLPSVHGYDGKHIMKTVAQKHK